MADLEIPAFKNYREQKDQSSASSEIVPSILGGIKTPPPSAVSSYDKKESTRNQASTHFLEKEPVMPAYQGGKIKAVKIKPMDKNLFFDGTNMTIKTFI
ncbi:hypothetical protein PCASD_19040 [Puccinia coronata f. sp. avenae]|uniref:Uncharacterized protein n=1 Tax=Puccinia coronata f. sp. avenae TaxID=200324 RepID=A0A2N5TWQ1_9BASI|nr:hypothetical protein PCASD_19040 [Puccinia coronata f. sp. avenae]